MEITSPSRLVRLLRDCFIHTIYFYIHFIQINIYIKAGRLSLEVEHDLNGSTTTSTGFKGFFYLPLREPEPMCYQGLHVDLPTPQELDAYRPCVLVPEHTNHINFPAIRKIRL